MDTYMINRCFLRFISALFLLGTVVVFAGHSAQAGFEWTPASSPKAAEALSPITPVPPVESVEIQPLQPQSSAPAPAAPVNVLVNPHIQPPASSGMKTLEMQTLESDPKQVMRVKDFQQKAPGQPGRPITINPYPNKAAAAPHQNAAPPAQPQPLVPQKQVAPVSYPEVAGFGADLPLALALRQVAPAHYSFSFGDGVNPGYRVSWNGGRPWNEVLNDMIAPLGLSAVIFEKSISITSNGATPPQNAQAQQPQPDGGDLGRKNITDPGEKS